MGVFDRIAAILPRVSLPQTGNLDEIQQRVSGALHRAEARVMQSARDARDHFTQGRGHVLDNVLRNAGNDVVNLGRNLGGNIGAGIGTGVGALFGGVGSIPGRHLGESAGRALGREVSANIVDGATGLIQDVASITPGLSRRGGERHIPNHNTLLERGLSSFAGVAIRPYEAAFNALGLHQPVHRLSAVEREALHNNSLAISVRPEDAEVVAAHNARLAAAQNPGM